MSKQRPKGRQNKVSENWLSNLQRKQGIRRLKKRFLIVCEDETSAVRYFQSMIKHLKLDGSRIIAVGSGHRSQPQQVVDRAREMLEASRSPESGTEPFDSVWCMIDGDYGSKVTNARHSADSCDIKLGVSTPCFEYWLILHFERYNSQLVDCAAASRRLRRHLPEYDKSFDKYSEKVLINDQLQEACNRAKEIRRMGQDSSENPEDQNPCSEVYRLIEEIQEEI